MIRDVWYAELQSISGANTRDLKAELLAPGGVEDYVGQGRIPLFGGRVVTTPRRETGEPAQEFITCSIPPKGVQRGDRMVWVLGNAHMVIGPTGEERGFLSSIYLAPQEARLLRTRVQDALNAPQQNSTPIQR